MIINLKTIISIKVILETENVCDKQLWTTIILLVFDKG